MKNLSHLEDHLGYWMRFVSNHVSSSFAKKIEGYDVNIGEWVVLRRLFTNPTLSSGVIAENTGMTRGAMSKLIERLVQKGLVERLESTQDRRFQEITLTNSGKKLVPILAALADENDAQFFGHLSKEKQHTLKKMLKEMVEIHNWDQIPLN